MRFLIDKWNNFTKWRERRRRVRALRKINQLRRVAEPLGEIRQFLYLDDVALRSLYVSRYGPEDARATISDARTKDDELSAGANLALSKDSSSNLGIRLKDSSTKTIQVEKVASEQSLFRDFLEREKSAGNDSQIWDGTPNHEGKMPTGTGQLDRGNLILIRILLQADLTYRISSFIEAISDLSESAPALPLPGGPEEFQIAQALQKLLINQAPIDARLIDWEYDPVSRNLCEKSESSDSTIPLRLVGLTEIDNYWLDVRRALFDGTECVALVRIKEPVPSTRWSPLKLFDSVRDIPGFEGLDVAMDKMSESFNFQHSKMGPSIAPLNRALTLYAQKMTRRPNSFLTKQISHIALAYASDLPSATVLSTAFDEVDDLLQGTTEIVFDPGSIASHRAAARLEAGLSTDGSTETRASSTNTSKIDPDSDPSKFLVGEIIALYW